MALYVITIKSHNELCWRVTPFRYSYMPFVLNHIPIYFGEFNCIYIIIIDFSKNNNHNLLVKNNEVIIISNDYIVNFSVDDYDKDYITINNQHQTDLINELPKIFQNNDISSQRLFIVDSILHNSIYYYIR